DRRRDPPHPPPPRRARRARGPGPQPAAALRGARGAPPPLPARALARATSLLLALAGGEAGALTEHGGQPARLRAPITLRQQRLDALLGTKVPAAEVTGHLRALGLEVEESPGAWQATPPSWRFDLAIEEDLVEEVARLHGYDQLPRIPGQLTARLGAAPDDRLGEDRIRGALVDRGFQEVITYSFIRPDHDSWFSSEGAPLPLANPISAELANMRRSVWPGLAQVCAYNLARQQGRVRIFEIGAKFSLQDSVYKQVSLVSGLLHGGRQPDWWQGEPQQPADFFDLKGDVSALLGLAGGDWSFVAASHPALHPGRCARIERDGEACGWIGELHPARAERLDMAGRTLLFEIELAALARCKPVKVAPVSRFPATRRDLAIVVARELPVAELLATVREAAGPVLVDSFVFDVYTGSKVETSQKSIALGLILQETSRTLTDEEVAAVLQRVSESLSRHHQARIRDQAWH
ncbi:MAG: phenylalanine--tRNA ligase subunit beta, partial [Chromatiales bacterium]|nr:phenylalanine--tRNA ligase subunit beta [Chromatiales bacterium]